MSGEAVVQLWKKKLLTGGFPNDDASHTGVIEIFPVKKSPYSSALEIFHGFE